METSPASVEPPPPTASVLTRIRRWLHWRRKRFWLITLPVGFVLGMIGTLAILFRLTDFGLREWRVGSWTIVEVEARTLSPAASSMDSELLDTSWWQEGCCPLRRIRIGPLELAASYHSGQGIVLAPCDASYYNPGFRFASDPNFGTGLYYTGDHWHFGSTITQPQKPGAFDFDIHR